MSSRAAAVIRLALPVFLGLLASLAATDTLHGQEPHFYSGTMTDSAHPKVRARLELAITERSDTATGGWLHVGPPINASGFSYFYPLTGDSVEMISVSAAGDTITWQSAFQGQRFGGTYRITGGKRSGQTGTWSLVATADPTRATRLALAIAGGLAAVGALFLLSRRVGRRRAETWQPPPDLTPERRHQLTGIGGWLAWFVFAQSIMLVVQLVLLTRVGSADGTSSWLMGSVIPSIRPIIAIEESFLILQLVGAAVGLALIVRRRPEAPVYWPIFLGMLAAYALFDLFAVGELAVQLGRYFGEAVKQGYLDGTATEQRQNTRLLFSAALWGSYWLASKRVRLTFAPRPATPEPFADVPPIPVAVGAEASSPAVAVTTPEPADAAPRFVDAAPTPTLPARPRRPHWQLAVIGAFGVIAVVVLVALAVRRPARERGVVLSGGERAALAPREIAALARAATVQIRALDSNRAFIGEGTGFFLSPEGLIGTNLHVIRDAHALQIKTLSGTTYNRVFYVTADARRDIAVLKIAVENARPLALAGGAEIDVGEPVYVMGNPLGQSGTFSNGLVSAQRTIDSVSMLQITAPVSNGSSGGPVLNERGEVVGMTTLMLRGGQNLNYAVPVRYLRPLVATRSLPRLYSARLLPSDTSGLPSLDGRARGRASSGVGIDVVGGQFVRGDSAMDVAGGVVAGAIRRGKLASTKSALHSFALERHREYSILAYCDNECSDLDLKIFTPDGSPLASDVANNDYPKVRFIAPASGTYRLRVTMSSCGAETCEYGFRLYRF